VRAAEAALLEGRLGEPFVAVDVTRWTTAAPAVAASFDAVEGAPAGARPQVSQ
jgi:hypothetical protein